MKPTDTSNWIPVRLEADWYKDENGAWIYREPPFWWKWIAPMPDLPQPPENLLPKLKKLLHPQVSNNEQ